MQLGVTIPIGNNGWLICTTSPKYKPSFDLNNEIVRKAETYGFDFALSMIKLHGFGGPSEFWNYNLESLHPPDGRAGGGHQQDPAVRDLRRADHAAADHRANGGDDRFDLARAVRHISGWQRREGAQMGTWPGKDHYNRRYDYCAEYVTIMRELWQTGGSDFKGDFFRMDDCRCLPLPAADIPIICAAQSDAGTRYAARHADYNFGSSFGVNTPTAVTDSVARLVKATAETGRRCGALVSTMIIADETDASAMAKWNHTSMATITRRSPGANYRPRMTRPRSSGRPEPAENLRHAEAADAGRRAGRIVCQYRPHAGRSVRGAGSAGRDADLRRLPDRDGAVRHPHPAVDAQSFLTAASGLRTQLQKFSLRTVRARVAAVAV
jgi:pyrimidine oxygenase